jgi:hypothetical protein
MLTERRRDSREMLNRHSSAVIDSNQAFTGALPEEVNTMIGSLARPIAWSQSLGRRITVALIPKAGDDLQLLHDRTTLSKTDLVNRAIISHAFIDAQQRAGRDLIVRDNGTGETKLVRFV